MNPTPFFLTIRRLSELKTVFTVLSMLCVFLLTPLPGVAQDMDEAEMSMTDEDDAPAVDEDEDPEEEEEEQPESDIELQEPVSVLQDYNLDGIVSVIAFGDSITRGVGDFTSTSDFGAALTFPGGEAGYPLRVEEALGVPVSNQGVPGERLTTQGLFRFASLIPAERPDVVIISGGSNDAIDFIDVSDLGRAVQTMINIADAVGTQAVILTAPPVCCDHSGFRNILNAYDSELRTRALVNELPLADVDVAYKNTCSLSSCYLLNRPEGLHPNSSGYDVSGEVVTATLLGIDILQANGPATLEAALMLPSGSVQTVPNPVPVESN